MSPSPSLPGQIARLSWARSSEFGQLPPGQLYRQKDRPQPVELLVGGESACEYPRILLRVPTVIDTEDPDLVLSTLKSGIRPGKFVRDIRSNVLGQ